MATTYCGNCGIEIDEAMNFCRRCGTPSPRLEATTRNLDTGPSVDAATAHLNKFPTSATYMPPGQVYPVAGTDTNNLGSKKNNNKLVIGLVAVFAFLLIAVFAGFLIFAAALSRPSGPPGDLATQTATGTDQRDAELPVPPPPPPPPGGSGSSTKSVPVASSLSDLQYPGSSITSNSTGRDGKRVLTLQTPDPADKVVDWYRPRIKPQTEASIFVGTVLKGKDYTVVITNVMGTHIVVTPTGKDLDF
jgi:hypothetical protein